MALQISLSSWNSWKTLNKSLSITFQHLLDESHLNLSGLRALSSSIEKTQNFLFNFLQREVLFQPIYPLFQ